MFSALKTFETYVPQKVVFGAATTDRIGQYLKEAGISGKAVIITDPGIVKAGIADRVKDALKREGFDVAIFDKCKPEPDSKVCDQAVDFARAERGKFVIGLGGGSSIDIAKVVAQLLVLPGYIEDYMDEAAFPKKGAPIIAIPTTSGTGSECTMYSVITSATSDVKVTFVTPAILPDMAVVDPTLTLSVPQHITAATGADALAHAIEAMLTNEENPFTDAIALKAVELIGEALPIAVYEGSNLEARVKMSCAAMLAGMAFNNAGLVEGHALAHTIGSVYHMPHGVACAIALPYVMNYNIGHAIGKLSLVAAMLGVNTYGWSVREAAKAAIRVVKQLLEDVGLPTSWAGYGKQEDIPKLAEIMMENPSITIFYRWCKRKMTIESAQELLTKSYTGEL
ncbi:MAG: Alcohol dehydrogenase [Thermoanaerobacterales bacterium 50_218]|nr:MAG: Alcohol dehydrogenase [Thermoanaerobacterales bacterium 50_218]